MTDQTAYEALAALLTGFQSGKASSAQINKALRQGTVMASVLAQFIANSSGNDVLDNGDTDAILANLLTALNTNGGLKFLQKLNNLSEISAAGSVAQAAARSNILAASVSGSSTQQFSVAAATLAAHAVRLDQFQSGNNGNGTYYKFPNVMQVCRFIVAVPANSSVVWTFPLSFPSAPQMIITPVAPSAAIETPPWVSTISATNSTIFNPSTTLGLNVNVIALL
ncbi:hypothetical protein [Rahnella aceris]|uniref:hypothetical protein n=1 Tax=Rahnella sp. (strain Y9602) TaxID=2703885 RepID=UPI0011D1E96A|nr:hypothetical protein [Rahnella aceris]